MTYSCHSATEIYPGLILGGVRDVEEIVRLGAQVLVPLDFLRGEVWETGFRGEILYYPVPDGGVLPDDVLESLVEDVLGRLGWRPPLRSTSLAELARGVRGDPEEWARATGRRIPSLAGTLAGGRRLREDDAGH